MASVLPSCRPSSTACSGYRQIARCSPTTVMDQAARLGRHALLCLARLGPPPPLGEPLVMDGFESFARSRYRALHLNIAVGARSHFVFAFTPTTLPRKGRMTRRQRAPCPGRATTGGRSRPTGSPIPGSTR